MNTLNENEYVSLQRNIILHYNITSEHFFLQEFRLTYLKLTSERKHFFINFFTNLLTEDNQLSLEQLHTLKNDNFYTFNYCSDKLHTNFIGGGASYYDITQLNNQQANFTQQISANAYYG